MTDRYRTRQGQHDYRDRYGARDRQAEQYSSGGDWQQGDDSSRSQGGQRWQQGDDFERGHDRNENDQRGDFSRPGSGYRSDTSSLDDYDQSGGQSRYGKQRSAPPSYSGGGFGAPSSSQSNYGRSSSVSGARSYGSGARVRSFRPASTTMTIAAFSTAPATR